MIHLEDVVTALRVMQTAGELGEVATFESHPEQRIVLTVRERHVYGNPVRYVEAEIQERRSAEWRKV